MLELNVIALFAITNNLQSMHSNQQPRAKARELALMHWLPTPYIGSGPGFQTIPLQYGSKSIDNIQVQIYTSKTFD